MPNFNIRFINSEDFVGRSIDLVTNSLWDHTEIQTETGTYIGAHAGTGIEERPADWCKPSHERRYSIPVSEVAYASMMKRARSMIGTPYDYKDILGLFFHQRIASPGREICSMFVFQCAWAGGLMMLNVLPGFTQLVTPETLHLSPYLIGKCTYDSAKLANNSTA